MEKNCFEFLYFLNELGSWFLIESNNVNLEHLAPCFDISFFRFGTITVKRMRLTNFSGRNILWSTGSLFLPQRTRNNSLSGPFVPCSCQITNISSFKEHSIKYMHMANDLKITSKCNRLYSCIVVVKRFPLMHNILFSDWWHCLVFISARSRNPSSVAKYSPADGWAGPRIVCISYLGENHLDLPHGCLRLWPDGCASIHHGPLINGKTEQTLNNI